MSINMEIIKKLRDETGAGVLEVKQALEKNNNDYDKTHADLMSKVGSKVEKKSERVTKDGLVTSYIHGNGKIGSLVCVACETDFVAKTDAFKSLCKEIAMQVCTEDYSDNESLLEAEYIRDGSKKIRDLINEVIAKTGEKVELRKFVKISVIE